MKVNEINSVWMAQHLSSVKIRANRRYTPKLNVDLPIATSFEALCRGINFYNNIRKHYGSMRHFFNDFYYHREKSKFTAEYDGIKDRYSMLEKLLKAIKEYETGEIPWSQINKECKELEAVYYSLVDKLHTYKDSIPEEDREKKQTVTGEINDLYRLTKEVRFFINYAVSDEAMLSNNPYVLLKGQAGIGKTHSLCDLIATRLDSELISILVFGEIFDVTKDFYRQICKQLDIDSDTTKEEFLDALDKIGEKQKSRVIFSIDAINETPVINYWKKWLPIIIKDLQSYKNICLVISIRSGYEDLCIDKKSLEKLIPINHTGFTFREWDAVKMFFEEFKIELPSIPILQPEFQVPLFLLLFCEGVSSRLQKGNKKQAYKGHEGATFIFENYVKSIAKKILKKYSFSSADKVYEAVIKPIAEGMAASSKAKDRLSESQLKLILKNKLPVINTTALISDLQIAHLIIKVHSYTENGRTKFYYKFAYQKFSDHLITRCIINKYSPEIDLKSPVFRKGGSIGKIIENPWNTGLIESLAIQLAERGVELFEVCPWATGRAYSYVAKAFIGSLVWRDPKRFNLTKGSPKTCIAYINTEIVKDSELFNEFLDALITIAPVIDHPLNALSLNHYFSKQKMPYRDGLLADYVYRNYEQNSAIDRLLEWSWTKELTCLVSDASAQLTAIPLIWFLATSNRKLRDRATKALVNLLSERPHVLLDLWSTFVRTDDPYILERFYAVVYGSLLKQPKITGRWWNKLIISIYKHHYTTPNLPPSLLIRSYIKAIVDEYYSHRKHRKIDPIKVILNKPSSISIRAPSEKRIKELYYPKGFSWDKSDPKDKGVVAIFNSMGDLDDFYKVTIKYAVSKWMHYKKSEKIPKTEEELKEEFVTKLSAKQLSLYNQINMDRGTIRILIRNYNDSATPEERRLIKKEVQLRKLLTKVFLNSLTTKQAITFRRLYGKSLRKNHIYNSLGFKEDLAKRWVLNRVFKLGYSPELHGNFDSGSRFNSLDEYTGKTYFERIGKKYQWIAYFELLGHLSDSYFYQKDSYRKSSAAAEFTFSDLLNLGIRDIDPSCTLKQPYKNGDTKNWYNKFYDINDRSITDSAWYQDVRHIPEPTNLLEIPDNEKIWLNLKSYCTWMQEVPPEDEEIKWDIPRREVYYIIDSFIVKTSNLSKISTWGSTQNFFGRWMPEGMTYRDFYIREYPHSIIFKKETILWEDFNDFAESSNRSDKKLPVSVAITNSEIATTMGSHDKTFEENLTLNVPSKWLLNKLKTKQILNDGVFVTKEGEVVFKDLYLDGKQPGALIANKDYLLKWLNSNGYSIVWTILGEKRNLYGMARRPKDSPTPIILSGFYYLNSEGIITGKINQFLDTVNN